MTMLVHRVAIERPRSTGEDDYGQPILEYETLDEIDALIQPKTAREVALLSQAGAELGEHTVHVYRTDLTTADRLRDITNGADGPVYQITGIRDYAFGGLAHFEVDARKVGAPTIAEGS
jgi:head-tail adaptor